MIKWYQYLLKEQESNIIKEQVGRIDYETGNLIELIKKHGKIKQLRVPSWLLQYVYANPDPLDVACVALENNIPVGIAVIRNEHSYYSDETVGILNLFVDSWHRDLKIGSVVFRKVMEHSARWKYIMGSRRTKTMMEKRGFADSGYNCGGYEDCIKFINPNYKESDDSI